MRQLGKTLAVASSLAVLLALGACGDRIDTADANGNPTNPALQGPAVVGEVKTETDETVRPADTSVMGAGAETGLGQDAQILVKVKSALAADPDLSALKIDVDAREGTVTLRGTAPDPAAKERAAEVVRHVKDVKSVDNQLTLG
ncbi:BON domain-containing protein [Caenimonas sedimenti]|uniref:BON domain-containing protein n=1 Tax=Caenimonas sedimenti TaxID=2596921 RepID=A0A562ZV93_9BURK|nr:BON domain-containing protein [Caenimonas sedimenti]TWO72235.1 BON domain-containing protein [Caenimonas sedimenti]